MPRLRIAQDVDIEKARAFIFCWNNPVHTAEEFNGYLRNLPNIRYYVFQFEVGRETGTEHIQGYMYFSTKKRLNVIRRKFDGCDVRVARGTAEQNKIYCTKEDTRVSGPFTWGQMPSQGRRTDWERLRIDALQQDETYLFEHHFPLMIRHLSSIQYFQKRSRRPPLRSASIIILIGRSGTGKSSYVEQEWPEAYWQPPGEWFPGYAGEKTVVLDDFYGHIPRHELLRMGDRFPLYLRCKNGNTPCGIENLIITSNRGPYHWYRNWNNSPYEALIRRMSRIMIFTGVWQEREEFLGNQSQESIMEKMEFLITHGYGE